MRLYTMVSTRRLLLVSMIACLLSVLVMSVASAHVGVLPRETPPDTNQTFTVRVPNEQDAPTVQLRIEFPAGLTVSRFQPKPGWQREAEQDSSGRITAVTWSGGQINAGEYDDFTFIARTPKESGQLVFKAYQSYQGGEVVEWINAEGADRPAPVVTVQAAAGASGTGNVSIEGGQAATTEAAPQGSTAATTVAAVPQASAAAVAGAGANNGTTSNGASDSEASDLPLFASLAALVIALIALALSGVSFVRRRGAA